MNRYLSGMWGTRLYRVVAVRQLMAPGKDAPVATSRLEMLLEGLQEAEARIVLERALASGRLDEDMSARVERMLVRRMAFRTREGAILEGGAFGQRENPVGNYGLLWGVAPDWRSEALELFELAADCAPFLE